MNDIQLLAATPICSFEKWSAMCTEQKWLHVYNVIHEKQCSKNDQKYDDQSNSDQKYNNQVMVYESERALWQFSLVWSSDGVQGKLSWKSNNKESVSLDEIRRIKLCWNNWAQQSWPTWLHDAKQQFISWSSWCAHRQLEIWTEDTGVNRAFYSITLSAPVDLSKWTMCTDVNASTTMNIVNSTTSSKWEMFLKEHEEKRMCDWLEHKMHDSLVVTPWVWPMWRQTSSLPIGMQRKGGVIVGPPASGKTRDLLRWVLTSAATRNQKSLYITEVRDAPVVHDVVTRCSPFMNVSVWMSKYDIPEVESLAQLPQMDSGVWIVDINLIEHPVLQVWLDHIKPLHRVILDVQFRWACEYNGTHASCKSRPGVTRKWNRWLQQVLYPYPETILWRIVSLGFGEQTITELMNIGDIKSSDGFQTDLEWALRYMLCFYVSPVRHVYEPSWKYVGQTSHMAVEVLPKFTTMHLPVEQMILAARNLNRSRSCNTKISLFMDLILSLETGSAKSERDILLPLLEWSNHRRPGGASYVPVPSWSSITVNQENDANVVNVNHSDDEKASSSLGVCGICLEPSAHLVRNEVCIHVICYPCLVRSNMEKSQCPMCRRTYHSRFFKMTDTTAAPSADLLTVDHLPHYVNSSIVQRLYRLSLGLGLLHQQYFNGTCLIVTHCPRRIDEFSDTLRQRFGAHQVCALKGWSNKHWQQWYKLWPRYAFLVTHVSNMCFFRYEKFIKYVIVADLNFTSVALSDLMNYFPFAIQKRVWIQDQMPSQCIYNWFCTQMCNSYSSATGAQACYAHMHTYLKQWLDLFT